MSGDAPMPVPVTGDGHDAPAPPRRADGLVPLTLIAAVAANGVIGRDGGLAWHDPRDARWFRERTAGCAVIMGRRTWDSLPPRFRPLPGRANVVVTRDRGWSAAGARPAAGLDEAIALARQARPEAARVFVAGGAQLYAQALDQADELLLTMVHADVDGDVRFPDLPAAAFVERWRRAQPADPATGAPAFDFVALTRRVP